MDTGELQLINLTEISRMVGMKVDAVSKRVRKPDFPSPVFKIGYMPVYHWPDVRAYFQAHPPRRSNR